MDLDYLDFEKPIVELDEKIASLASSPSSADIDNALTELRKQSETLVKKTFANLNNWQISQLARHPKRPYTLDYISAVFDDFMELHGDGRISDDRAIIGGIASLEGKPIMFIGQQKGRTTKDKIYHNFGMPSPEGYRKALRLMQLADKFSLPLITFVDTPGAYPGITAEEHGQSESIATNLRTMPTLRVPIISVIIGEGGSGGALAIAVADRLLMFEYSIYSVISPEGCASILYKDVTKANLVAENLKLSSAELYKQGLVDVVIKEPLGGAHRHLQQAQQALRVNLSEQLEELQTLNIDDLISKRHNKILNFGN